MPQRELIGPNAPLHATLPLTGGEVFHAVDEDGESVVVAVEDLPSGAVLSGDTPEALGVASPGTSDEASPADHVHAMPTAAEVGAPTTGDLSAVSTVANNALPKPGGTTTANGIVTGSGTAGAAVAISTTTIADLEPKSGVQAAHSGATRTLADADHNKHQVLSTATELRFPTTLTAGLSWTGRMSGANPVTFAVGGGYIPIEFLGKNTATLAGTRIFVFVESATLATVTIVEKVP